MSVNGTQPFIKVIDSNGLPIVGAKLHVYEAGTTTYRAIYSDSALSVSLTNPLTGANASNANGDFPRFYMASGTYKLRAETSAGTLIWEYDDIDTGISAGAGALPISSGGTGGTTAAAARANLDVPSNSELSALSSEITTLSASVQNIVSVPQGRLTLTTGVPVLTTGVSAATTVYYTSAIGNIIPIYDGVQFVIRTFSSDLVMTLSSNHVASAIYDFFAYWDGTDIQIATGVAWNTATAGAGARGTGAGTTELVRVNGLWVNKFDLSYRNGATTGTLTANKGTYLGSIFMDGTNGQVTCHTAYGQSRKWGIWNAYNRSAITLLTGDGTASWSPSGGAYNRTNASSSNSCTTFCGLPEEPIFSTYVQNVICSYSSNTASYQNGIGINSAASASGVTGFVSGGNNTTAGSVGGNAVASIKQDHGIGINALNLLEGRANTVTASGGQGNCQMKTVWLG